MAERELSYWDIVKPVMGATNIYDGPDVFLASFAKVLRPIGIVYAAHFCLSEVHNGGFLQFFWNATGVLAPEALEGFQTIGMPKLASVMNAAMEVLGPDYPRDRDERWNAIVAASPLSEREIKRIFKEDSNLYSAFVKVAAPLPFDDLDKQAWELASSENDGFDPVATQYLADLGLLTPQ